MFSTLELVHPKQCSLLLFCRKAVKTQAGCFNPCFVCVWRSTEVSILLHKDYTFHVHNWQRVLVAVVLSRDELAELQFTASLQLK